MAFYGNGGLFIFNKVKFSGLRGNRILKTSGGQSEKQCRFRRWKQKPEHSLFHDTDIHSAVHFSSLSRGL
jgi:hypothetical protein